MKINTDTETLHSTCIGQQKVPRLGHEKFSSLQFLKCILQDTNKLSEMYCTIFLSVTKAVMMICMRKNDDDDKDEGHEN